MREAVRVQGGFGSAGSSRSLRRTATSAGVGTTAGVLRLRESSRAKQADLGDPPAAELRSWIEAGRCWWCRDERTFRSLSGHWVKAHDINLQDVRDILQVPKGTSFIDPELRERFQERGRRLYDASKLRQPPGHKHHLSAFGIASQARRFSEYRERIGEGEYRAALSKAQATVRTRMGDDAYRRSRSHPQPARFCQEPNCGRGHLAHDLCSMHLQRQRAGYTNAYKRARRAGASAQEARHVALRRPA